VEGGMRSEPKYPGTVISACGRYRYTLERKWEVSPRFVLWLMLNPSTADATTNDATIRRCMRYAADWGFGGILVGNLYAYRATQPAELFTAADPVGPQNDTAILEMVTRSQMIVCAWGQRGPDPRRRWNVLRDLGVPNHRQVRALRINENGEPGHPLRLPLGARPIEWDPVGRAAHENGHGA
jgi:hypothetical protein